MIIFISGISTSGKTSLGKLLCNNLHNSIYIDQDTYFVEKKKLPQIQLAGHILKNYDSEQSIDWDTFNLKLLSLVLSEKYKYIIVGGFCLLGDRINIVPDIHFFLKFNNISRDIMVNLISVNRKSTKGFSGSKVDLDKIMVEKIVIPFYYNVARRFSQGEENITVNLYNFEDYKLERKTKQNILLEVMNHIYRH